jgi:hypothetical protein
MKTALVVILFTAFVFAQDRPAADSACGPSEARFDAQASAAQPLAKPDAGKALVYVAEDFTRAPGELGNPTIRVGLNGEWKGATRANSYLSFPVDPGENHLCVRWQSHLQRLSRLASFAHLNAEPGQTYYFRARITYSTYGANVANMTLDLEPVDPDEGQYLVATFRPSSWHEMK